jgi:N-acetylneuraminate synthase
MQCNTNYTAYLENYKHINLNVLTAFKKKFPDAILGLSDHTHGHATVLGAIALGARVFEKHFTDDNSRTGPDHKFAMNPESWKQMVYRSNELYQALGDGIKKIEGNEKDTAIVQRRALRYSKDMQTGHKLGHDDLFPLRPRPADGIPPYDIGKLIGKKLKRDVKADALARREDI